VPVFSVLCVTVALSRARRMVKYSPRLAPTRDESIGAVRYRRVTPVLFGVVWLCMCGVESCGGLLCATASELMRAAAAGMCRLTAVACSCPPEYDPAQLRQHQRHLQRIKDAKKAVDTSEPEPYGLVRWGGCPCGLCRACVVDVSVLMDCVCHGQPFLASRQKKEMMEKLRQEEIEASNRTLVARLLSINSHKVRSTSTAALCRRWPL
jgi:hypothetical protein